MRFGCRPVYGLIMLIPPQWSLVFFLYWDETTKVPGMYLTVVVYGAGLVLVAVAIILVGSRGARV